MAYADHTYYLSIWHGDMPDADFAKWAARASIEMDRLTRGRARAAPECMLQALQLCCCELADALRAASAADAATQGGIIASENIDGYAVSYRDPSTGSGRPAAADAAVAVCRRWLCAPVNLMYTGVRE